MSVSRPGWSICRCGLRDWLKLTTAELDLKEVLMDGKHDNDKKPKTYTFFVGSQKYETMERALTGAQIKAYVPDVPPGTKLSLEGHGHETDRIIADDEKVSMDHGHGPRRFTLVPPANFG
jgi:hypothetical protein